MKCSGCMSDKFSEKMTKNGVLIDYCESCGGIWLDKGEIYFFTKSPSYLKFQIEKAVKDTKPSNRKNPKNGNPLVEISLFNGKLILDYDPISQGIYLDKGELESLPGYKELGINIELDSYRPSKARTIRSGLMSLPNLTFSSFITLTLLYLILGLFMVAMVEMNYIPPDFALKFYFYLAVIQFVLSPFLMDFTLRIFYGVNWITVDELPQGCQNFVRNICRQSKIKVPRFGLIQDGSPNAFTYGHYPSNARIILTEGMYYLLEDEELNGVIAHEVGHAVNWDMLLMTVANLVPMILYYFYKSLMKMRGRGRGEAQKKIIAFVAYLLYVASHYVVLWFSRVREYYADRFSGKFVSPHKLSSALVKIGYGLAGVDKGKKTHRDENLEAVSAMGIFDAGSARNLAISSPNGVKKMGESIDKIDLKGVMRWDLWNPWASWYEFNSTHPLIAKRLLALSKQSLAQGEQPYIVFDEVKPESYWDDFLIDLIVYLIPPLSLFCLFASGFKFFGMHSAEYDYFYSKWALLAYGLSSIFKVFYSYRGIYFPEMNIKSLLKKVKVSGVKGIPVRVKGKIIGRGIPGYIFSEDFVLQDDTGIIFLDYRQPLRILDFLFSVIKAGQYKGKEVVIEGWYRRSPTPYIEIKKIESSDSLSRCYTYYAKLVLYSFAAAAGIISFFVV